MVHRVARKDLDAMVVVVLATASALVRSRLKSKLPHEADWARRELARTICDRIDNDSYMVIVTETVGLEPYRKPGRWGVDEPVPAIVPEPPKPPDA